MVRTLLHTLRGLVQIKRQSGPRIESITRPILVAWRFFVCTIGIRIYRLFLLGKRQVSRFLLPAKHRTVYLVSNRYALHAAVILIAVLTSAMNFGGREVRAETFGQESMLYDLVAQNRFDVVEVVSASSVPVVRSNSYLQDTVIDVNAHIDLDYLGESYVTPLVGGEMLFSPTIHEEKSDIEEVIPVREEVTTYVIQEGDVLGSIAEKHGLSLSTILWANNLTFRSVIQPGQELNIPPVDGVVYKVKNGDTLSSISRAYSVDVDKILSFNQMTASDVLSIGQELILPDGEPPVVSTPIQRTASVSNLFSAPTTRTTTGGMNWVWPTDWHVITQYYGWNHTGLDVDGDYSTNSYAAADGVVIYSGWRNGYGMTVEIDHGNGYMTRYAHHTQNYVSVGDVVYAGQAIAQTGTTGRSTGTHLHFEIIKDGRFLNPLDYIR